VRFLSQLMIQTLILFTNVNPISPCIHTRKKKYWEFPSRGLTGSSAWKYWKSTYLTAIYWVPLPYTVQSKPEMLTRMEKGQELLLNYSTWHPLFPIQRPDDFFKASPPFHSKAVAHLGVPVTEQTPSKSCLSVFVWKYPGNARSSSSRQADLTHPT